MKKRVYNYLQDNLDDFHYEGDGQIYNTDEDLYGEETTEIYVDEGVIFVRPNPLFLYDLDHSTELSGYNEYSGYSHLGDVNFFIEEHGIYQEAHERDRAAQYYRDNFAYQYDQKKAKRDAYWENVEETRTNSRQYDSRNRNRVREKTRERVRRYRAKKKAETKIGNAA